MKKRCYLAAAAAVALAGAVGVATFYLASGEAEDTFAAKYRLIHEGTTYEEAVALLGPPVDGCPSGSCGYTTYFWKNQDGVKYIALTWAGSELVAMRLGAIGADVIPWESPKPWWREFLSRLRPQ